jgi:hypothetical protein
MFTQSNDQLTDHLVIRETYTRGTVWSNVTQVHVLVFK